MQPIIYKNIYKKAAQCFRVIFIIFIIFILTHQDIPFTAVNVWAAGIDVDSELELENEITAQEGLTSGAAISTLPIEPIQAVSYDEVIVGNQAELQSALDGDASIIRIVPDNGGDVIILDKALTIAKNRNIAITADKLVKITGVSNYWLLITNIGSEVSLQFSNVTLDGNNMGDGLYNRGRMSIENAVLQNFKYKYGGIYSVGDLTVSNCLFTDNAANSIAYGDGGGIFVNGKDSRVTVSISNTKFTNNRGSYGGAVRIDNADGDIINCEFFDNTAAYQGSCLYTASSDINIVNCLLKGNTGSGAILVNNSVLMLTDSEISENNGRGMYCYTSGFDTVVTLNGNTTIRNNIAAESYGGGILGFCEGAGRIFINIEENTEISGNIAKYGGGISSYPGISYVVINISDNTQIINNKAYENGGGIYGKGVVNINGGLISLNEAKNGGGIYGVKGTPIIIENSVISDNLAVEDGGGIWVADLSEVELYESVFYNNSASTGHFWRIKDPADDKQSLDAVTHSEKIINTTYTSPYTNAYSNHDIRYATDILLTPYTVLYDGNNDDEGIVYADHNGPYLYGEEVMILAPPLSLGKSGCYFAGWNTEPDGTGIHYAYDEENDQFEPPSFIMEDANIILYAQWETVTVSPAAPPTAQPTTEQPTAETESNGDTGQDTETTGEPWNPEATETIPDLFVYTEPDPAESLYNDFLEMIPVYPPDYQLIQLEDEVVELEDADNTPMGLWVSGEDGWMYYPDYDTPQVIPNEDGSFEVHDQNDTPVGLWSKDEDDKWVYEEYEPINTFIHLIPILIFIFFLAGLLFFIITRKRITREEFVRMIVSALGLEVGFEDTEPYKDVSEDAAFYDAIMTAKAAGLLAGFKDSEFKPHAAITREEMASILAETARYAGVTETTGNKDFRDVKKINNAYLTDVYYVTGLHVMLTTRDGRFDPTGLSKRSQTEEIVDNLMKVISRANPDKD